MSITHSPVGNCALTLQVYIRILLLNPKLTVLLFLSTFYSQYVSGFGLGLFSKRAPRIGAKARELPPEAPA